MCVAATADIDRLFPEGSAGARSPQGVARRAEVRAAVQRVQRAIVAIKALRVSQAGDADARDAAGDDDDDERVDDDGKDDDDDAEAASGAADAGASPRGAAAADDAVDGSTTPTPSARAGDAAGAGGVPDEGIAHWVRRSSHSDAERRGAAADDADGGGSTAPLLGEHDDAAVDRAVAAMVRHSRAGSGAASGDAADGSA